MGFKEHIRIGRHPSPDALPSPPVTPHDFKEIPAVTDKRGRSTHKDDSALHTQSSANDPDLTGKQPKRSSSFGRGLGGLQSLANGMSRAGESLSRKSANTEGVSTPNTHHVIPANVMGPPSLPDSSHLAQYSLKLSELVNKAFFPCTAVGASSSPNSNGLGATSSLAGAAKSAAAKTTGTSAFSVPSLTSIIYEGKRLPSKIVINEIAIIVVAELEYAASVDPYLLRAVSRQSLKALTMFADRIDSLIVTPSKDTSALYIPSTAKEAVHLPAALEFNLGLISLEWIVEDALERCIEGSPGSIDEGLPHFVSEILTPVRKKMETTILHVVQPLLFNAKASLYSTISKSVLAPFAGFGQNLTPISSANAAMTPGLMSPSAGPTSPPVVSANSAWLKELEGKVEATRRLLIPRLEDRCGQDGEGWFISVAIHAIWKGLLILTSKSLPVPSALLSKFSNGLIATPIQAFAAEVNKRAPSPAQLTSALKSVSVVGRSRKGTDAMSTPSGTSTPSNAHLANHAPGATLNVGARAIAAHISDLQAFEKLMLRLAAGFGVRKDGVKGSSSSANEYGDDSSDSESDEDDEDELARAALAEALQAIRSTILVAQYLDVQPEAILDATKRTRGRSSQSSTGHVSSTLPSEVIHAAKAIPSLLLLQLVYARMPTHLGVFSLQVRDDGPAEAIVPSPPAAFGYSWTDYERAIAGFAGGQTWAKALTEAWRQDVEEAQDDIKERKAYIEKQTQTSATKPRPIQLSVESPTSTADGTTEATPTPESVLMQRSNASPATSAGGRSSESLPEMMTKSAPDLKSQVYAPLKPVQSNKDHSPKLGSNAQLQVTQSTGHKERPTWSFIRSASRKVRSVSGSETSSPQKTPDSSPPHTPAMNATRPIGDVVSMEMNSGKAATPQTTSSRKFWRTPSSQGGAQSNAASTGGGFHLPTLNSVRSAVSSRDVHHQIDQNVNTNTMSESERAQEEIRLESECVRLLSRALDAVQIASRSNSTSIGVSTADATKEIVSAHNIQ